MKANEEPLIKNRVYYGLKIKMRSEIGAILQKDPKGRVWMTTRIVNRLHTTVRAPWGMIQDKGGVRRIW